MAVTKLSGVQIRGIASAVPANLVPNTELAEQFGAEEVAKLSDSIGVHARRVAPPEICTSDLCFSAAERLIGDLGWERDSIDAVLFVSQSYDYLLPATSCVLQSRLGLSKKCAALDIGLGCSGYVYGLWLAAMMLNGGGQKRVLLMAGDTSSRNLSPHDRATVPLFGDAGTVTALEAAPDGPPLTFQLGTDGGGANHLIIPAGAHRIPRSAATGCFTTGTDGIERRPEDLFMNGAEIFVFTLREVPALIRSTLAEAGWGPDSVDGFIFHQANKFLLEHLTKKMKLPVEKVPIALDGFGNTSSASIPLAICATQGAALRERRQRLVLAGFGVGLSWGAVTLECGPLTMPEIIEVGLPTPEND